MTEVERIRAILRHEKPDRIPVWPIAIGFCTLYSGRSIADVYNNPAASLSAQRQTCKDFGWVCFPHLGSPVALAPEFGGEIKWPSSEFSQAPMIVRYPVETDEDVWKLQMPDVKTAGTIPLSMDFCKLSSQHKFENEPFNIMLWAGGPFTSAVNIAGIEKLSKWMIKKPDVVHRLLRLSVDYYMELSKYWKDTFGTEKVLPFFGEPATSNQIISARQFEQFAMPYIKELSEALLNMGYRHIFVHICGEQNLNLPYWAKIPFGNPGIISIGHEVQLHLASQLFPDDIIMGNLEPAIIQTKTPGEVYEASREVIEEGKKIKGGFIFSPGCELPPRAPLENIRAMTKAIEDHGYY